MWIMASALGWSSPFAMSSETLKVRVLVDPIRASRLRRDDYGSCISVIKAGINTNIRELA